MDGDRLAREQDPAYRATLLLYRRGETKSPLTFLIYLKQFVTLPIASFPKFTGRKIGQSGKQVGQKFLLFVAPDYFLDYLLKLYQRN